MSTYHKWYLIRLAAWVNVLVGVVLIFVTRAHILAVLYLIAVPGIFMMWSACCVDCRKCGSNIAVRPRRLLGIPYVSQPLFFLPRTCWRCGADLRTQFPTEKDRHM
jgi:hypothetical protein